MAFSVSENVTRGPAVLCLHTFIILDIMRDPTRDNANPADRLAALSILSAMKSTSQIVGLLAEQVQVEFMEYVKTVREEAERALSKLRERLRRLDAIKVALGAHGVADISHYDDHVSRSKLIAECVVRRQQCFFRQVS
ncbi:hypothetical protein GGD65_006062 [Bradyrhizobium sp. CIR18]|uniref:hypothetical protein n=1 Tax=Bradyrhizobium sp. CIR18 TaxID=2663839 RepID=UPI0016066E64|nr:hypothetical protein [Bradyrhizobium sp. CIR18]MBB4364998.1 hypothetical protein [Bradyrhizobium sp. CIR18]